MHNAVRNASNKYSKHRQNENEANDITWSQIFDAKQQCWKNVTQLTRWPCSIMNSKYRLRLQKNICNGQRFASFYCCLAFARFWKVKFWRSFIKCKYFNDGWTDFHKNIYLYIFILGFFRKPKKTLVSHRVKMVTRTWKMTHWPGDPMTQFHVWSTQPVDTVRKKRKSAPQTTILCLARNNPETNTDDD